MTMTSGSSHRPTFGPAAVIGAARRGELHPELSTYDIAVLLVFAEFGGKDGEAYPSTATVAAMLRCSRSQVHRSIEVLVRHGYLRRARKRRYEPTAYTVCLMKDSTRENPTRENSPTEHSQSAVQDSTPWRRRIPPHGDKPLQITTPESLPAAAGAQDSTRENPGGGSASWILDELRRHPSLTAVATEEFAAALLGHLIGKPRPSPLVLQGIREAAVDVAGLGLNREAVAKKVRGYVMSATDRPAPARAKPGAMMQPGEGRAWTSNPVEIHADGSINRRSPPVQPGEGRAWTSNPKEF